MACGAHPGNTNRAPGSLHCERPQGHEGCHQAGGKPGTVDDGDLIRRWDVPELTHEERTRDAEARVRELRSEAEWHQRRVDSFNAQADQIERTWGLREPDPEAPATPAFDSFRAHPPSVEVLPA